MEHTFDIGVLLSRGTLFDAVIGQGQSFEYVGGLESRSSKLGGRVSHLWLTCSSERHAMEGRDSLAAVKCHGYDPPRLSTSLIRASRLLF
jgi:hypothetical protein